MRWSQLLVMLTAALVWSTAAQAVPQFTPTATARLHTLGSGGTGAEFNTGGVGAGGNVAYDSGTGLVTFTAVLDVMNWYDTASGSGCETDVGSNCSFNFSPDLDISLTASLDSFAVAALGGTFFQVTVNFGATGGVDLSVTDPSDGGSVQLEASVASGTFQGNPTTGLASSLIWDTSLNGGLGGVFMGATTLTSAGFLQVDSGTPLASLFSPDFFGIEIGTLSDFDDGSGGGLDEVIRASILAGTLVNFTAEANGQILNTVSGDFVPEPGTALLLGLAGLVALRRRR